MAFLQNTPNVLGCGTVFDKRMLGRRALQEEKRLDGGVIQFPMAVSARFVIRVGSGKGTIKILV